MTHRRGASHLPVTAMIAGMLGASLWGTAVSAQDLAYPRFSPITIRAVEGGDEALGRPLSLPFGTALPVVDRGDGFATVTLQDGTPARIRIADLFIPPTPTQVRAAPTFAGEDRARLSFWDSILRAEGFLRNGPSPQTRPLLQEIGTGGMPAMLPVSDTAQVPLTANRSVMLANALVPMAAETLALMQGEDGTTQRPVTLHVIVDASPYARDFSQRRLQDLSRMIEAQAPDATALPRVSQTVLFNSGAISGPDDTQISGLRRTLPAPQAGDGGDLSSALIAALDRLRDDLAADTARDKTHLVLVLLGPGLRDDLVQDPAFVGIAADLRQISDESGTIGLLLGAVTPEPSDAPARVLGLLGDGLPSGLVGFDANLGAELADILRDVTRAGSGPDSAEICAIAQDMGMPCLHPLAADTLQYLRPDTGDAALEWVGLPLWFVVDGTLLVLERHGAVAARAEPDGSEQDAEIFARARLAAAQARSEIARIRAESAATITDLQDRAAGLDLALAASTRANDALAGRIADQDTDLDRARVALASLERTAASLRADLSAATGRAAGLAADLAAAQTQIRDRDAALAAAQSVGLDQARRIADLDRAATDAETTRQRLEADLAQAATDAERLQAELAVTAADLVLRMQDLDRQSAEVAALQAEQAAQAAEHLALETDLARTADALVSAEAALAARQDEITALNDQITDADAERARLDLALAEAARAYTQLETDLAAVDADRNALLASLDQARAEGRATADQLAQMTQALAMAEAERAAVSAALDRAEQARSVAETEGAATAADLARSQADLATRDRLLAEATQTLARRDVDLAALVVARDDQSARLAATMAERDALRQSLDAQTAELAETRDMLNTLWADAEAAAAGQTDLAVSQARLEHYAQSLLSAETRIADLTAQDQGLRARLAEADTLIAQQVTAHTGEIARLRAEQATETDRLQAAHAADLGLERDQHAMTRQAMDQTRQALSALVVELHTALDIAPAQAAPGQSDLDLMAALIAETRRVVPETREALRRAEATAVQDRSALAEATALADGLRASLSLLEPEIAALRDQMQLAARVTEENQRLVAIVEQAERMMLAQDDAYLAEQDILRRQLAQARAAGVRLARADAAGIEAAPATAPAPAAQLDARPRQRPASLDAAALPVPAQPPAQTAQTTQTGPVRSLQVMTPAPTVRTGTGFFGN